MTEPKSAYAAAGVDIEAGDAAVELMKAHIAKTRRPEVLGGIGGFAGLFDASALAGYRHPVLATSTDGVGTKVAIASAMGVYHTVGWDLMGMLVDDLVVCGAEPLFVTDYIACGKVFPDRIADIVRGIADACAASGAALLGGETAEHPGLLDPDEFDIAGATVGVVEKDAILGADRIQVGDVVLALASSGLHSNGYSLVRHVLLDQAGLKLDSQIEEFGCTLGEELLTPTHVYAKDILELLDATATKHGPGVHAISHITGGGLANNLARVIPSGMRADIDRSTWTPQPVFDLVWKLGKISRPDIEATLNMGVGMAVVLPADLVDTAKHALNDRKVNSWVCGRIVANPGAEGSVELFGNYAK
jgi:phosphoribosylformylglycinamidine cyclo-ligase